MKLIFAGYDLAAARNLAPLVAMATNRSHRVVSLLNCKMNHLSHLVKGQDLLVSTLASLEVEEELALVQAAKEAGVPWLIIAENHYTWARPKAQTIASYGVCLVASPVEIEEASSWGYREAIYVGGPPLWHNIQAYRIDLKISPDIKVVLVSGIKHVGMTNHILSLVVSHMQVWSARTNQRWKLLFSPHPNEPEMDEKSLYERQHILMGVDCLQCDSSIEDKIYTADLAVFTSGSTGTVAASIMRYPNMIYFETDWVRERMISQIGRPDWLPAEEGAVFKATPDNFGEVLEILLLPMQERPPYYQEVIRRQERVYPYMGGINPSKNILDLIEDKWGR